MGLAAGDNLYAYVNGNPISNMDPDGKLSLSGQIALWTAQAALGAYQGYRAGETFRQSQCSNPPPSANADVVSHSQHATAHAAEDIANGASAFGKGYAKLFGGLGVALATGKFRGLTAFGVGYALGGYFGAQHPCACSTK